MSNITTLLNGDCLELMKQLGDKSIDLVLTDPPYGVELDYDSYVDTEANWYSLMAKAIPEMQRIGKCVIMPSCQIKRLQWIYANFPPSWLICWYKGSVGHNAMIGFNDWEPHLVYGKPNRVMHDYFKATPEAFDNGHPCPKPLSWAKKLISMATNEGDTICDPFMGSGTTGVAAKKLDRNFIGYELSTNYFKIAEKRINEAKAQMKLIP